MNKQMANRIVLVALLLGGWATALAQQPTAKVSDLHFMTGTWRLQHEWGDMTEAWSDTAGNNLMCSFRCVNEGKLVFYEFIVVEQEGDRPVMKLRHFGPGSTGWEEKDKPNSYPLILLGKNKAVFEKEDKKTRLTYIRDSDSTLTSFLEREEAGKWTKDVFSYRLAGR